MKRNLCLTLLVFFILSACQPGPDGQWQAATATQAPTLTLEPTSTWTPAPTPTPEVVYKINPNLPIMDLGEFVKNYERYTKDFSTITFDDILTGKILEEGKKYVEQNKIFGDEIFQNDLYLNGIRGFGKPEIDGGEFDPLFVDLLETWVTQEKPETRPFKIISFFAIDDNAFFDKLGVDPYENDKDFWSFRGITIKNPNVNPLWAVLIAYHNPSGEVTPFVAVGDIFSMVDGSDIAKTEKFNTPADEEPYPIFFYDYIKVTMPEENIGRFNLFLTYSIYKNYPELKPDPKLVQKWASTEEMPKDLQNSLFGINLSSYNLW